MSELPNYLADKSKECVITYTVTNIVQPIKTNFMFPKYNEKNNIVRTHASKRKKKWAKS